MTGPASAPPQGESPDCTTLGRHRQPDAGALRAGASGLPQHYNGGRPPHEHAVASTTLLAARQPPRFKPTFGPYSLADHPVIKYSHSMVRVGASGASPSPLPGPSLQWPRGDRDRLASFVRGQHDRLVVCLHVQRHRAQRTCSGTSLSRRPRTRTWRPPNSSFRRPLTGAIDALTRGTLVERPSA